MIVDIRRCKSAKVRNAKLPALAGETLDQALLVGFVDQRPIRHPFSFPDRILEFSLRNGKKRWEMATPYSRTKPNCFHYPMNPMYRANPAQRF